MLKHKAMEASTSAAPAKKKLLTQFEPVKIGPIYSLEEMDMKVLQFQNKKLAERIEQRRKAEDELRRRIEQLEQRQTTDDAVLCIVNRYWNQLDEDVRVLLQRFDAEGADESGKQNESKAVTAFLTLLSQWDKPEIEDKLRQRVEFSERAIGKLLQAYDRLLQRNEKLWEAIKDKADEAETTAADVNKSDADISMETDEKPEVDVKKEEDGEVSSGESKAIKKESDIKKEPGAEGTDKKEEVNKKVFVLAEALREEMERLMAENKRVQDTVTELSQAHHETTLKNSELSDKLAAAETEVAELRNQVEELEYNLQRAESRVDKLDRHLANTTSKLATYQEGAITVQGGGEGVSKNKFNELVAELEEQRELATNRLGEMEKLNTEHQEALKETEKLKLDLSSLPESVIVESTEYKCLQSQFSVLYNESMQMKTQLEEARNLLASSKNTHLRQIEQMESDELMCQKKLRTDVIQLEDQLAQVRREYELLRMEFEQTLAANEQTGPINREMRNLISSLKNHNEQLKGETARYKRKLREAHIEINKLKAEQQQQQDQHHTHHPGEPPHSASSHHHHHHHSHSHHHPAAEGDHPGSASQDSTSSSKSDPDAGDVEIVEPTGEKEKGRSHDLDNIRELKMELKKSQDRERDMKMLLDVYKTAPKETRDKAQLMMSEKKYRSEIEELKRDVRRLQEFERRERRRLGEDEAMRKIKKQDEHISELQKKIQAQKQEEDTLLSEMEVTGQAFEDMQEQNIRLLQQLREKDDANFKLMSERIKSNQIHKLLREEKEVLVEQVETIQTQVEAQNQVVRRLEEKEQILQNNLGTVEKELALRQQAMEQHKRKAVESAQTAADLKLHLDKYHSQLKEAQNLVSDKTEALQSQAFKYKRVQEDVASSRRKLERAKKIEQAASADEVLLEEIREYKEQLTCPSCKVKKKDAVLTKCFHVFCLECLRTRYETRQRKCPKCNATFGANDYHRIYLE